MTEPLHQTVLKVSHTDQAELIHKQKIILGRLGYVVTAANPGRISVGALAKLVRRSVPSVSRSLRSPSCPPFVCTRGKKRILELEPNDPLLTHLTNPKQ